MLERGGSQDLSPFAEVDEFGECEHVGTPAGPYARSFISIDGSLS
jgi:hypothetical protein